MEMYLGTGIGFKDNYAPWGTERMGNIGGESGIYNTVTIQVMEKAIKAHVVKVSGEAAPRSHNLIYLSEKAGLKFDVYSEIFLGILMKHQLHGRYPDYNPLLPDNLKVNEYFIKTKSLFQWLKERSLKY